MKPAYFQNRNTGHDRWMVSYLDVLTILLILFVAIAAQALQRPAKTLEPPLPVAIQQPTIQLPTNKLAALKLELEQTYPGMHLDVQLDARGLVISLPQTLLFALGEDRINDDALSTVGAIGNILGRIPNSVVLVGHADAVPIHNRRFGSNWELAAARGLRLLELLVGQYGIAEARLSVESHGSFNPKTTNDTPAGRAGNRRVEIVILDRTPG